jgi:ureidoglycolate hydrolase
MVNAWNVGELDGMVLPPCHYGFQLYTRELTTEEQYAPYQELIDVYKQKIVHIKAQEYHEASKFRDREKEILKTIPYLPGQVI